MASPRDQPARLPRADGGSRPGDLVARARAPAARRPRGARHRLGRLRWFARASASTLYRAAIGVCGEPVACTRASARVARSRPRWRLRPRRRTCTCPTAPIPAPAAACTDAERASTIEPAAGRRLRLRADGEVITFVDAIAGRFTGAVDDVVLARGDGVPAYNLAVVVDDADQGVTQVVRGDDLLSSTPRQLLLQRLLGHRTARVRPRRRSCSATTAGGSPRGTAQSPSTISPPRDGRCPMCGLPCFARSRRQGRRRGRPVRR